MLALGNLIYNPPKKTKIYRLIFMEEGKMLQPKRRR